MNNNSKHPLEWFEQRVGTAIFREPIFESEKGRKKVAIKIRDKNHANQLFQLQRADRPPYTDTPYEIIGHSPTHHIHGSRDL